MMLYDLCILQAFIKLESMTENAKCGQLEDLSVEIFTKYDHCRMCTTAPNLMLVP